MVCRIMTKCSGRPLKAVYTAMIIFPYLNMHFSLVLLCEILYGRWYFESLLPPETVNTGLFILPNRSVVMPNI